MSQGPHGFARIPLRRSLWREARARVGFSLLGILSGAALLGQALTRLGVLQPDLVRLPDKLRAPLSLANAAELRPDQMPWLGIYILGTDEFGRSLFDRLVAGAAASMFVGLSSIALASALGLVLGAAAGFFGQRRVLGISLDAIILRLCDTLSCFPTLFLALTVIALLPQGPSTLVLVIGLTSFMAPTRLVRAEVLALRSRDYVLAVRALGLKDLYILRRHVVPAVLAPLIVSATLGVAFAVLTESALSFLGFGLRPPHATWGNLLAGARPYLFDAPWLFVAPGLCIFFLVLGAHLLGDALQKVLRPQGVFARPGAS